MRSLFLPFLLAIVAASTAVADEPVALVEDVSAKSASVEFMDYVPAGKVIKLGQGETLTLSYLKSCVRETIAGGEVTVGVEQSSVASGTVDRQRVKCDPGKLQLTSAQSAQSGVVAFRKAPSRADALPKPQITLYGTAPVLALPKGGTVTLERLDPPGERLEITVPAKQLRRGAYHDLAAHGKALSPGALYRASASGKQIVFRIDPHAQPGRGPLVGRLLQFAAN